ncbi:MAG: hypothetical protein ACR2NN_06700 [Bryobacteraceae bacterium]
MRSNLIVLVLCCASGGAASFPSPDLTKAKKIGIWATEYHVHQVPSDSGSIPLLTLDGKQLGPRLSAYDFCHAALEGTVRIGAATYNVSGAA